MFTEERKLFIACTQGHINSVAHQRFNIESWTRPKFARTLRIVTGEFMLPYTRGVLTACHKPTRPPRNTYFKPLIRDPGIKDRVGVTRADVIKGTPVINIRKGRWWRGEERDSHLDANSHHGGIGCIVIDSLVPVVLKYPPRPSLTGIERERDARRGYR